MQMKILITGAGGYIGSHLLHAFLNTDYKVLPIIGTSNRSIHRLQFLNLEGVPCDTRDYHKFSGVVEEFRPNVVIHLAGLKSPQQSNREKKLYLDNNLGSLSCVYETSLKFGVSLLINASSSSVYGDIDGKSISENQVGKPISVYGVSKKLGEELLSESYNSKMRVVSLRLFNVIGSVHSQLIDSASFHLVPATINRIKRNYPPEIYGNEFPTSDGTAIRDYVHILDVVDAFKLIIDKYFLGRESFSLSEHMILNIGSGVGTSVLEIVTLIGRYLNKNVNPTFLSSRDGDPAIVISNIKKATNILGFSPKRSLHEMLQSCL